MKMPSLRKLSKTKAEKKILTLVAVHRREETAAEEISEECGFCGNKGGNWRDGGGSCDQPSCSHWKGQCYNYTHQRKSMDSECEARSAHLQLHEYTGSGQKLPGRSSSSKLTEPE